MNKFILVNWKTEWPYEDLEKTVGKGISSCNFKTGNEEYFGMRESVDTFNTTHSFFVEGGGAVEMFSRCILRSNVILILFRSIRIAVENSKVAVKQT